MRTSVYIGGVDILRVEEDTWDSPDELRHFSPLRPEKHDRRLFEKWDVAVRSLKVTFTPRPAAREEALHILMGGTARKE